MLVFETLKNKESDFLNSNTCFYSRLYGLAIKVAGMFCFRIQKVLFILNLTNF